MARVTPSRRGQRRPMAARRCYRRQYPVTSSELQAGAYMRRAQPRAACQCSWPLSATGREWCT